jgi:hypothetical protein
MRVKPWFERRGVPPDRVTEMDWWEEVTKKTRSDDAETNSVECCEVATHGSTPTRGQSLVGGHATVKPRSPSASETMSRSYLEVEKEESRSGPYDSKLLEPGDDEMRLSMRFRIRAHSPPSPVQGTHSPLV